MSDGTIDGNQGTSAGTDSTVTTGGSNPEGNSGGVDNIGTGGTDPTVINPPPDSGTEGTDPTVINPPPDSGTEGTDPTVINLPPDSGTEGTDPTVTDPPPDSGTEGTDTTVINPPPVISDPNPVTVTNTTPIVNTTQTVQSSAGPYNIYATTSTGFTWADHETPAYYNPDTKTFSAVDLGALIPNDPNAPGIVIGDLFFLNVSEAPELNGVYRFVSGVPWTAELEYVSPSFTQTTTVTTTDINADGDIDVTQTNTVVSDADGNVVNSTINVDGENVDADLEEEVDLIPSSSDAQGLLAEIAALQAKVSCEKLQHLGSMEDYAELFRTAQQYMATVGDRNINLLVDTEVLDKFAAEAQVYAQMFAEVNLQFSRLSTVDELEALRKVKAALLKITQMYENIDRFHATITASSILQIPESIKDVSEQLQAVTASMECSLPYLEYFADKQGTSLSADQLARATLDVEDKAAIDAAVAALNVWLDMINNEANVTMNGNEYVKAFKAKIAAFDPLYDRLHEVVGKVQARLDRWRLGNFA